MSSLGGKKTSFYHCPPPDRAPISIENGSFAWDHGEGSREVLKGIDLTVKEGALVGVVGAVGAGKSSLCSAILGEMEKTSGKVTVKVRALYSRGRIGVI